MENNDDFHTTTGLLVLRLMVGTACLGVATLTGIGWAGFTLLKFKTLELDTPSLIIGTIVFALATTGIMLIRRAIR